MTSDSSPSAEGTSGSGGGGNSYSQRNCLPSPWAQVVRGGGEPEPVAPRSPSASSSSVLPEPNIVVSDQLTVTEPQTAAVVETHPEVTEGSNNGNASGVKKSAWNKPSPNGVVEGSTTPVMGAASWPALSELTKALPKSLSFSSESSSKPTSDGSVAISQAPVISQQPQRPVRPNANHHANQNHGHSTRQRPAKRGGGAGGGYNRPPPPPPQPPTPPPMPRFPLYEMPYRGFVPAVMDTSVREQSPYNGNSFAPRPMGHSNAMNDHSSTRRRNNFGPRPRGDGGPYLNNGHGGRRDHHDRDWRGPQNHAAIQPPMAPPPPPPPRGYMQQAHLGPAPFIAPQPIRPYGAPMGYEMAAPFLYVPSLPTEPYRGAPILPRAPPPPMFIPLVDTPLPVKILQQIEYYFSEENLTKDDYLKSNMNEEGWVPLSLIAGFRRVQSLTSDIQLILSSLRDSTVVEVQDEIIRSRRDWQRWVKSSNNGPLLEASLQNLTPGETSTSANEHQDL
ncbi:hypothetical protein L2E82_36285 [Cichorium intybus]|uniref:Uncharacterized protein n=1 Tax=Cichorium intybus TaxID=13427 RepID=A0ACB9BR69_CICIN|nr:hypothetical protein L2E82_36285 [Cichorium intybus]